MKAKAIQSKWWKKVDTSPTTGPLIEMRTLIAMHVSSFCFEYVFSCSVVSKSLFITLWIVLCQASLSMEFSR